MAFVASLRYINADISLNLAIQPVPSPILILQLEMQASRKHNDQRRESTAKDTALEIEWPTP